MSPHHDQPHCSHCGQRTPAKRLHDLGALGVRCERCLARLPSGQRRMILRRARAKEALDAV